LRSFARTLRSFAVNNPLGGGQRLSERGSDINRKGREVFAKERKGRPTNRAKSKMKNEKCDMASGKCSALGFHIDHNLLLLANVRH